MDFPTRAASASAFAPAAAAAAAATEGVPPAALGLAIGSMPRPSALTGGGSNCACACAPSLPGRPLGPGSPMRGGLRSGLSDCGRGGVECGLCLGSARSLPVAMSKLSGAAAPSRAAGTPTEHNPGSCGRIATRGGRRERVGVSGRVARRWQRVARRVAYRSGATVGRLRPRIRTHAQARELRCYSGRFVVAVHEKRFNGPPLANEGLQGANASS